MGCTQFSYERYLFRPFEDPSQKLNNTRTFKLKKYAKVLSADLIPIIIEKTAMSIHPEAVCPSVTIMKILLVGESNVGKTSLITRYHHDKFEASSNLMTVGIDIRKLNKKVDGRDIVLERILLTYFSMGYCRTGKV